MDIRRIFVYYIMYSITKNTTTAGQAGLVCGSNRISGRKQKPARNREEVLTDNLYWNPFHLWNGGCQIRILSYLYLNTKLEIMTFLAIGTWQLSTILIVAFLLLLFPLMALISVLKNDFKGNDKIIWVLLIIFLPFLGALLYFLVGRGRKLKK